MPSTTCNYLSFRLGNEWYGVSVHDVIEVLHLVALSEVPGTEALGLMTLRDRVLPVLDLRQRFNLAQSSLRLDTPIIAVETAKGGVGLLVDETDDVHEIKASDIMPYDSRYVKQVARFAKGLLLLLDVHSLS